MFNQPSQFDKIEKWVRFIRDLALLIGVPVLITVGLSVSNLQKEALQEQVELLKLGQADRALSLIKAKDEINQLEREVLEDSLASTARYKFLYENRVLVDSAIAHLKKINSYFFELLTRNDSGMVFIKTYPLEIGDQRIKIAASNNQPWDESRIYQLVPYLDLPYTLETMTHNVMFMKNDNFILEPMTLNQNLFHALKIEMDTTLIFIE